MRGESCTAQRRAIASASQPTETQPRPPGGPGGYLRLPCTPREARGAGIIRERVPTWTQFDSEANLWLAFLSLTHMWTKPLPGSSPPRSRIPPAPRKFSRCGELLPEGQPKAQGDREESAGGKPGRRGALGPIARHASSFGGRAIRHWKKRQSPHISLFCRQSRTRLPWQSVPVKNQQR